MKCANVHNGCEWRGTVRSLAEHISTCSFPKVDTSPHTPGRQCSEADVRCYVFIDYCNLWFSGQLHHGKNLVDTTLDHRFRVDLGKFLPMVTNDRHLSKAFLYGPIPPKLQEAAREKGYTIKSYETREANAAMASDILLTLHNLLHKQSREEMVFIIITGDSIFRPLIEEALYYSVPVELWSWKTAMSQEYHQLAHMKNFTAKHLDGFSKEFSYSEYMSTRKKVDPAHAIVYRDVPADDNFLEKLTENRLCQLRRQFFITKVEADINGKSDLIIEFPESDPGEVLADIRKRDHLIDHQPCSYPEYRKGPKNKTRPILIKNRFQVLGELSSPDLEESSTTKELSAEPISAGQSSPHDTDECDSESASPWKIVRRQPEKISQKKCWSGDHCPNAAQCPYHHTKEELELFRTFPKIDKFKTKECSKKDRHTTTKSRRRCSYAHDKDDSWCLKCKKYGHLTNDCHLK